jgi:hypothetical protein
MEEERIWRTLYRIFECAEILHEVGCCAEELRRLLWEQRFKGGRKRVLLSKIKIPLEKEVEVPGFLRPVLGDSLKAGQLRISGEGVEVGSGFSDLVFISFEEDAPLYRVLLLALVVNDWDAVLREVYDNSVYEEVERLAKIAKIVRLALQGSGVKVEPCPCPQWQAPPRSVQELLVRAAMVIEEGGSTAARLLEGWRTRLFWPGGAHSLRGFSIIFHPDREVEVPGWLAGILRERRGLGPPYRLETVHATSSGSVEVVISGLRGGGEATTRYDIIYAGSLDPFDLLVASYVMAEDDWRALLSEARRQLEALSEAYSRLKAAVSMYNLLA